VITANKDTVLLKGASPNPLDGMIVDEIYGANGDTIVFFRKAPEAMLYTAERAREHKVRVKSDMTIGGSPIGYMVFDDTTKYTRESVVMLDGQWKPYEESKTASMMASDTIKPSTTEYSTPQRFSITHPVHDTIRDNYPMNPIADGLLVFMLAAFSVYKILSVFTSKTLSSVG
jgi:hypothetical protein